MNKKHDRMQLHHTHIASSENAQQMNKDTCNLKRLFKKTKNKLIYM